jgi:hypothetical protein
MATRSDLGNRNSERTSAARADDSPASQTQSKRVCAACRQTAPADASEYTLIGSRYGWRVTKSTTAEGSILLEWRCRECFAKHRAKMDTERPGGAPRS